MSNRPIKDNSPLVIQIHKLLASFQREEPYIMNTAKRIAALLPQDLIGVTEREMKEMMKIERNRGYANGYAAGKKSANL